MRRFLVHARPFEFRPVEPIHVIPPPRADPLRHIWVKTVDRLPDDPDLHRNVLAYVSDYQLVATSTLPHGIHFAEATCSWRASITQCGFTGPFRVDDWLLYAMQSPNASGSRFRARPFFTRSGELVASTEGRGCAGVALAAAQIDALAGERAPRAALIAHMCFPVSTLDGSVRLPRSRATARKTR